MTKYLALKQNALAFLIPIVLLSALILLLNSNLFLANQSRLSIAITIDFIITIPLVYFLLIRKRNISNFTVAPFLIASVIIASYVIPTANQEVLDLAKTWLIPVVELSVLSLVAIKVRKAILNYRKAAKNNQDFYDILLETCQSIFPKTPAKLVANEIALFYYGFFNFKNIQLQANEYSNYKGSGILSTLGAIIFVVAIEMVTVHILTAKWSTTLAWVLTGLSFYSALQLIGIIRSVPKRPITVRNNQMILRFGILSETVIPYDAIERIETANSSNFDKAKGSKTLSLLGELEHSNIAIYLKAPQQLQFLYGTPKAYTKLFLFVDDHLRFKSEIEQHLSK